MDNLKFKYTIKDDIFIWDNGQIKVIFSNPSFQACDELGYVKSYAQIIHYYYTVSIYKKVNMKNWKLLTQVQTYDFPHIIELFNILKKVLFDEIDESYYAKFELKDGKVVLELNLKTEDFFSDDFYNITRTLTKENGITINEKFSCYIGCSLSPNGDNIYEGIWLNSLTKDDMLELYNCVNDFISYSIKKHNEEVINRNKEVLQSHKIEGKKLYTGKEKLESVVVIGDKCDIYSLKGDIDLQNFSSVEYSNCIVVDITENEIIVEKASYKNQQYTIPVSKLLYVYTDVENEKFNYNVDQIAEDWVKILNEKEREEFKTESVDKLFEKWSEAIIDRTWMCRPEHNLEKLVEDKGNHENVYANVREVIKIVKSIL